jgi:hypothetical protein
MKARLDEGKQVTMQRGTKRSLIKWQLGCHNLKYSILGCEYLLQYVHLSIGFSKNFKDFSGNYSIYPRARFNFFILFRKL